MSLVKSILFIDCRASATGGVTATATPVPGLSSGFFMGVPSLRNRTQSLPCALFPEVKNQ